MTLKKCKTVRTGLSLLMLGMAFLTAFSGCGSFGPESKSGDDQDRIGAVPIELNQLYLDDVDCLGGDKTDWKYFSVPAEGDVSVTFAFDEPAANGTIVLRKQNGEEITRVKFKPGARTTHRFHAMPVLYYLEIFCEAASSEYSLEVTTHN